LGQQQDTTRGVSRVKPGICYYDYCCCRQGRQKRKETSLILPLQGFSLRLLDKKATLPIYLSLQVSDLIFQQRYVHWVSSSTGVILALMSTWSTVHTFHT